MRLTLQRYWKVAVGLLFGAAGGIAVITAWTRVRNLLEVADQVPLLISGGIGGLGLLLVGVWLLRSHETDVLVDHLRDTTERLDRIQEDVARLSAIFERVEIDIEPAAGNHRGAPSRL